MIRKIFTALVIFLILGLAFWPKIKGFFTQEKGKNGKEMGAGKDKKGGGKASVEVWVVQSAQLQEQIQTTGSLIPNEEVEIRSEVAGRLVQLNINEGEFVKKGTLLFKINDEELQARLKKFGYSEKLAENNEARQKKLLEKEAISQREYDVAVTSVNTIQADIEEVKALIAKSSVYAPFDGRTGFRYVSAGSYLSPNTRITTLTSTNPIKLDFSIPAKYANQVQKGSRVAFSIEGNSQKFTGTVYAIDPKIDPQTRTLLLRAVAPNPQNRLIPGDFAKISLITGSKGRALMVPTEAVIPEVSGQKVFVVENGKAMPRKISIGQRTEREVEVTEGLNLGDSLIVRGILQVKPEGEVEVIKK
jgi:membrane fusion protein, multidrug efflux system